MQVLAHNLVSQFTNRQLNVTTKKKKMQNDYRLVIELTVLLMMLLDCLFQKNCVGRSEDWIKVKIIYRMGCH